MKKFTILSLLLAMSFSAYAQNLVQTTTKTETESVNYITEYKSKLSHNIYIQGSFGGTLLMGEDDSNLSFGKRITPGFMLAIGKRFTPVWGARISVEGNRLLGWNDNNGGYAPNHSSDPRKDYLDSKGVNTSNGYDQNIKYYSLSADLMIDLVNAFSKEKRSCKKWDVEAYFGIGAISTIERKGIDDYTIVAGRGGISTTYNFSKHFGVNFEIGGTITGSTFDGHTGEDVDFDGICSAKLGIRWKIGKQGFKRSHSISSADYEKFNNYLAMVKTQEMAKGEPKEKIVVVPAKMDKVLVPFVVFQKGKDTFNQELQMVNISNVAKMLNTNPNYKMEIVGNTKATDAQIAERRANKVKEILVNRYSIEADRLIVKTEEMADSNQTVHFIHK